jgi:hypothetical protein
MPRSLFPVQLKMTFYSAHELPEMMTDFFVNVSKKILRSDAWELVDPYMEVNYNGIRAVTDPRNGCSPVWSEALYLVGQFPPLVRVIKIALRDHSAVQQDRVIGSFLIDLFLISESNPAAGFLPTFGSTWMFFYGTPREYTISKDQDGLGEGVCYKGRLLMEIGCHPISGDHTSNTNIQKESGIPFPAPVEDLSFPETTDRSSSFIVSVEISVETHVSSLCVSLRCDDDRPVLRQWHDRLRIESRLEWISLSR